MKRYTIKQLNEMSDIQLAICILQERLNKVSNAYSPLADKLRCAIDKLENIKPSENDKKYNCWNITFTDKFGDNLPVSDISQSELDRIGGLVSNGINSGKVINDEDYIWKKVDDDDNDDDDFQETHNDEEENVNHDKK